MSLLSVAMKKCIMLDKSTVDDGYGGYVPKWRPGVEFQAAIVFDTSIEARRAEAEGVTSLYTVTTSRAFVLEYHDVFQRLEDGKYFRVTSDGNDKYTPPVTALDMRQVTAEEFTLPNNSLLPAQGG